MPKYLLTFEKSESVRWLGHLDILRTFERAIRRAGLPIAFTQGFNPRERLVFASALGTGITGGAEKATLELTTPLDAAEIQSRLTEALPPGIRIHACEGIPDAGSKDVLNAYSRAEYSLWCACPEGVTEDEINDAVQNFVDRSEIMIAREREGKTKHINIRPLVQELICEPGSLQEGRVTLRAVTLLTDSGSVRPPEIVQALSAFLPGITVRRTHRTRLIGH